MSKRRYYYFTGDTINFWLCAGHYGKSLEIGNTSWDKYCLRIHFQTKIWMKLGYLGLLQSLENLGFYKVPPAEDFYCF